MREMSWCILIKPGELNETCSFSKFHLEAEPLTRVCSSAELHETSGSLVLFLQFHVTNILHTATACVQPHTERNVIIIIIVSPTHSSDLSSMLDIRLLQ